MKVEPKQLDALLHPTFDPAALKAATPIATGLPASPGAACGAVYFTAEDAAEGSQDRNQGCSRPSGDLSGGYRRHGTYLEGIMTARGGMTSHAAVVARGMGTCCVAGVQRHQGFRRG